MSGSDSLVAPWRGLNLRDPLANMQQGYALQLDNWFTVEGEVQLRPGITDHATAIPGTPTVKTLAPWTGTTARKLFAVTDVGIFDVTAAGAVGAAVQAYTNGFAQFINFNTTGQSYLVLVNGVNDLTYTNGTTWATIPNFTISTGGSINTNLLSNINAFKRSLYFIEKDSMNFYYLPVDQITGTVSRFPLGALFSRGGKLVAMGTWSLNGGNGPQDYSVFATSEGQAAVYRGTNPSSATDWELVGVYDMAEPLGERCFCEYAGDLLLLTRIGLYSMNQVARAAPLDNQLALSALIAPAFVELVNQTGILKGWQAFEHPGGNALVVNVPANEFGTSYQYVMNLSTMAWSRFTGWNGYQFAIFDQELYLGMTGRVAKAWKDGNDFGGSITTVARCAYFYASPRARLKEWKLLQPVLSLNGQVSLSLGLDTDFSTQTPLNSITIGSGQAYRFDQINALFNQAIWSDIPRPYLNWFTVAAAASYCASVHLRLSAQNATITWSATNFIYEPGALR